MPETVEHVEKALRSVIENLHDAQKGFAEAASEIRDHEIKTFFLHETQVRAEFAAELDNQLHHLGVKDVNETGTTAAAIHRAWGDLKVRFGGGDHALLVTVEQGEDEAKETYEKALEEHLPGDVEALLMRQQHHILQSHNRIRSWRDAKADL